MTATQKPSDGVSDPHVSRSYRQAATERVPGKLNASILDAANRAVGNRYSRSISWLRPMAWAATVGLSLAIVIELSNVPQPEDTALSLPATIPAASTEPGRFEFTENETTISSEHKADDEQQAASTAGTLDERVTERRQRNLPDALNRALPTDTQADNTLATTAKQKTRQQAGEAAMVNSEIERSPRADNPSKIDSDAAKQSAERSLDDSLAKKRAAPAELDAFRVSDAPMLQQAAEIARVRDGPNQEAAAAIERTCNEDQTAEPEVWLVCIEELEAAGYTEVAELQREQLREAFPDFERP